MALDLLDAAQELDLRSPHQDFFNPIWTQGWRAGDLVHIGTAHDNPDQHPEADQREPAAS